MAQALKGMEEHSLTVDAGRLADQNFHSALLPRAAMHSWPR